MDLSYSPYAAEVNMHKVQTHKTNVFFKTETTQPTLSITPSEPKQPPRGYLDPSNNKNMESQLTERVPKKPILTFKKAPIAFELELQKEQYLSL